LELVDWPVRGWLYWRAWSAWMGMLDVHRKGQAYGFEGSSLPVRGTSSASSSCSSHHQRRAMQDAGGWWIFSSRSVRMRWASVRPRTAARLRWPIGVTGVSGGRCGCVRRAVRWCCARRRAMRCGARTRRGALGDSDVSPPERVRVSGRGPASSTTACELAFQPEISNLCRGPRCCDERLDALGAVL
jgi:hypothetical protein